MLTRGLFLVKADYSEKYPDGIYSRSLLETGSNLEQVKTGLTVCIIHEWIYMYIYITHKWNITYEKCWY